MKIHKGKTYILEHSRKGVLTVLALENVDLKLDRFFEVEIIDGEVNYLSQSNRAAQEANGIGTPGHRLTVRTTLIKKATEV